MPRTLRVLAPSVLALLLASSWAQAGPDPTSKPEKAVKKYSRAVEKAPDDPDSWYNLGWAHVLLESWDEAVPATARAVELAPDNPLAHFRHGEALMGAGRPDGAVEAFGKAAELDPSMVAAHANLGNAHLEAERYDEAIDAYKSALRTRPDDPGAFYNNIGDAYFKKGEIDQAIKWFERTVEAAPNDPISHFNLGAIYTKLSREDPAFRSKAADAFMKASDLDPRDEQTVFLAGEALLLSNREEEARTWLQRYLEKWPNGSQAQLAELYLADLDS